MAEYIYTVTKTVDGISFYDNTTLSDLGTFSYDTTFDELVALDSIMYQRYFHPIRVLIKDLVYEMSCKKVDILSDLSISNKSNKFSIKDMSYSINMYCDSDNTELIYEGTVVKYTYLGITVTLPLKEKAVNINVDALKTSPLIALEDFNIARFLGFRVIIGCFDVVNGWYKPNEAKLTERNYKYR